MDRKKQTKAACDGYLRRVDKIGRLRKVKIGKPEKLTEKNCLLWMRDKGFSVEIIEAGGGIGKYGQVTVKAGYPDCSGVTNEGRACFIEFKAKDRMGTIRPAQYKFLKEKINTFAFAVCVDSDKRLEEYYNKWMHIISEDGMDAGKLYLLEILPTNKKIRDMFDEDDSPLF